MGRKAACERLEGRTMMAATDMYGMFQGSDLGIHQAYGVSAS